MNGLTNLSSWASQKVVVGQRVVQSSRRGSAGCPPVPPGHKPVAVVFDLVHPLRPVRGCSADEGKQGSMKPVGARNKHVAELGTRRRGVESAQGRGKGTLLFIPASGRSCLTGNSGAKSEGRETMIRMIAVAFALALATSAQAMPLAPLHQPDRMITEARFGCGPGRTLVAGRCVARTTITRRVVRRSVRY
jgi:hypothetical protein